jgi:hypothetical protein
MCDHCPPPRPIPETRRSFLRKVAGAAAAAGMMGVTRAAAQEKPPAVGRSGWGRLITSSPYWTVHREQDPTLASFVRSETNLKIDPTCYPVDPGDLDRLCHFPLLFTNNLADVRDPRKLLNIREYLYRGGFIYIDGCVNANATPDGQLFLREHLGLFPHLVPGSEVRRLTADHPIFSSYFKLAEAELDSIGPNGSDRWAGVPPGLFGIFDDDRMVMLFSLDHLQCGWPESAHKQWLATRQIANIYVYAAAH